MACFVVPMSSIDLCDWAGSRLRQCKSSERAAKPLETWLLDPKPLEKPPFLALKSLISSIFILFSSSSKPVLKTLRLGLREGRLASPEQLREFQSDGRADVSQQLLVIEIQTNHRREGFHELHGAQRARRGRQLLCDGQDHGTVARLAHQAHVLSSFQEISGALVVIYSS